jgi:ubiquinone/menaquinone biosynthesis C-methylase UbiE
MRAPGWYQRRVFPWLNDKLASDPELLRIRAQSVAAARGRVIEIGFGTGLNVSFYPDAVKELVAVEPNAGMVERGRDRIEAARFPVTVVQADAEHLPFEDASFDTAVSVLTLCSVSDPARALAELHRVLRPDGRLLLLEHGLADDPSVARWQNRLDWLQGRVACGCHLNRPIAALARRQGFGFDRIEQYFAPKMPRTHGWITVGEAAKGPPVQ